MKLVLITALFCVSLGYSNTDPVKNKEKIKKENKSVKEENPLISKSFHSVRKWKIVIEYTNGGILSKTIVLNKNSSESPMETAFKEAEKYTKNQKNIKNCEVFPVSDNSFVLLAGN